MLLELVEPDLADELRADAGLLQLARPPAIRLGEAALGRALEERQDERGDLVVPPGADSRRADVAELAVVVVEPEEERRDPALGLRLPAHADDHAVRGPVRLHLDDALAGAGEIRQPVPLGDHAVEAGRLEPVQPLLRSVSGARDRRELEALAATLQRPEAPRRARPPWAGRARLVRACRGRLATWPSWMGSGGSSGRAVRFRRFAAS